VLTFVSAEKKMFSGGKLYTAPARLDLPESVYKSVVQLVDGGIYIEEHLLQERELLSKK